MTVLSIVREFQITGKPLSAELFGGGHINDTFKVEMDDPEHPGYLLQRINHQVFSDVEGLMKNIQKVTLHLQGRSENRKNKVLHLIPTKEEELFYKNENGYWRVFHFLEGTKSYEKAQNADQAYEAANAFGRFLEHLSDFPPEDLHITIPYFHNMQFRINQFQEALNRAPEEKITKSDNEIDFIKTHADLMISIFKKADDGGLPLRVTHNDTKFNNVLMDEHGKARAVIDLDTVMPGFVFYDVGDGIRSGIITADEDEADLKNVTVDREKYEAFLRGYLDATANILTKPELEILPHAGPYMAFIMGVRFLTDYLDGDIYYKTKFPEHNYQRARCQLHVCKILREQASFAEEVIS